MNDNSTLTTKELSELFHVRNTTVHRAYCVNGHYLGLKPVKLPNHRLLWPKSDTLRLLEVDR